jgi:hypothetical protein
VKSNKTLLYIGAAVAVVLVLVLLARRSSSSPTVQTLGGDPTGNAPSGDAVLQARSTAFASLANLLGSQWESELAADTQNKLADLSAGVERDRLSANYANSQGERDLQLSIAKLQAGLEDRRIDSATDAAEIQSRTQLAAAKSQGRAQTATALIGLGTSVAEMIGKLKGGGKGSAGTSVNRTGPYQITAPVPAGLVRLPGATGSRPRGL